MRDRVEPARSVRIAVPAYTGLSRDTEDSVMRGCKALVETGIEIQNLDVLPSTYIDRGRCILVANFLTSTADDLVFIDADVGFEADSLVRLCQATRPVVAGIYPKKMEPREWPVTAMAEEVWSDRDGLVPCRMVPTGFMRIHRSVFEALNVPHFHDRDGGRIGAYFKTEIRDGQYWGEDVEFCRLVREAGGQPYAFADMYFRHTHDPGGPNEKVYSGSWGPWLREQMREAA